MMGASCTPAGGPPALAALFLTVAVASAACATARTGSAGPTDHLAADLTTLIDTLPAATASLPGALLRVEALTMNFVWTKAIGTADLATGVPLHFDQTLRIASNTKTFFAAAILRLAEEDALELDAAIATLIEPSSALLLESGGYSPQRISVRMLSVSVWLSS